LIAGNVLVGATKLTKLTMRVFDTLIIYCVFGIRKANGGKDVETLAIFARSQVGMPEGETPTQELLGWVDGWMWVCGKRTHKRVTSAVTLIVVMSF